MVSRRHFVRASAAFAAEAMVLQGCSAGPESESYDEAVRRTWQPTRLGMSNRSDVMQELVRYATLAPSSHNTQCWSFAIEEHKIAILPDLTRRCPAVDPDNHHLFVSLGCATENLMQAAMAHGFTGEPHFEASGAIRIALSPTKAVASSLFTAIPSRQSTRAEFDGRPVSSDELRLLEVAGTGNGVRLLLLTAKTRMEEVLEYVVEGNTAQMSDSAFVAELKEWIRFSDAEAVRAGDGLSSRTSGSPSVPRWVGSALFPLFFKVKTENDKYVRHVRSSSGIAVFVSEANDAAHWVEVGRCFERFALQATALGIRCAMLNQPVEVASVRPQFATALGLKNARPDLVVRFGRGPEMPRSLRRPLAAVIT